MSVKNNLKLILGFLSILISTFSYSQTDPFEISLEPLNIYGLGGIQSYAFGQHNGKWLLVGGRLDGLHRRQPWAAFDAAGNNNQLIVVDPATLQKWSAPLTTLPISIQEQLKSANMEFYQEGDNLYCLGGYGYSEVEGDHTTFNKLTAIKVSAVIDAVISNGSFSNFFRQITDNQFQVTGGRLKKINDTYYLLGGQKFIGRYNPMGPNHGPGFVQEYTNAIRKFNLSDDGTTISITHLEPYIDIANLHRRDYNAESQILPDGSHGITMFSGVFQPDIDLPFLNAVTVDVNGYSVENAFQQYLNHYHCPALPLYSEKDNEMHTVFFGGIAQYTMSNDTLYKDDNVPFVRTIARVTRDENGQMGEYKLPIEMPTLLGAGAEFIPNLDLPKFENGVFRLDSIPADSLLIGHIFGGISSSQANIFFINDGTQSTANNEIFKVYIKNALTSSTIEIDHSNSTLQDLLVYPNPAYSKLNISFHLANAEDVRLFLYDLNGAKIDEILLPNLKSGDNIHVMDISGLIKGRTYLISLETSTEKMTQKVVIGG